MTCIQPPEIDNETQFFSSRSSTEVSNSDIPDLPMYSQDIARGGMRKSTPVF